MIDFQSRSLSRSFVLFELAHHRFGIATRHVREMIVLGPVSAVPGAPPHVRGVTTVRGAMLPTVDMRRVFGLRSYPEEHDELLTMFEARKQDHIRWLRELRASVAEDRPFTLATDPHQCAFGKWYDGFRVPDPVLSISLARFDRPHRAIHALAGEARGLAASGRRDEALAMIERSSTVELSLLVTLFDQTAPVIAGMAREVMIVAVGEGGGRPLGLIADSVSEVCDVDPSDVEPTEGWEAFGARLPLGLGMLRRNDGLVALLDGAKVLAELGTR